MFSVYLLLSFVVSAHNTPHHVKIRLLGFHLFPYLKMMKVGVRNPIMCVGIETRLRAGRFRVWIPAGEEGVLQNICTGCTAHPASYSIGTKVTAGVKGPGSEVSHLHVVPRLRMCGTIFLAHLSALMIWTEKDLPSPITTSALRYKPESRGSDSFWRNFNFSLT